jgi:hypothetical protein
MKWCATECLISLAHVQVRHRILIFVAKILWRTTHAPQNMNTGAPQMRFSLLVVEGWGNDALKGRGAGINREEGINWGDEAFHKEDSAVGADEGS